MKDFFKTSKQKVSALAFCVLYALTPTAMRCTNVLGLDSSKLDTIVNDICATIADIAPVVAIGCILLWLIPIIPAKVKEVIKATGIGSAGAFVLTVGGKSCIVMKIFDVLKTWFK